MQSFLARAAVSFAIVTASPSISLSDVYTVSMGVPVDSALNFTGEQKRRHAKYISTFSKSTLAKLSATPRVVVDVCDSKETCRTAMNSNGYISIANTQTGAYLALKAFPHEQKRRWAKQFTEIKLK